MKDLWRRYKEFFNRLNASNRNLDYITNLFYLYTVVPYVTLLFLKLKLSANMATIISGTFGSLAGICIYNGNLVFAGLLIIAHQILDIVDGNLARLTKTSSAIGAKLDLHLDRLVRTSLLLGILFGTNVQVIFKIIFITTLMLDIIVVHKYVLPFMKKHPLVRASWKKWFIDRGMIPAFDIFTMYFLLSILCLVGSINSFVYIVIVGKNLDWIYRVWECIRTKHYYKKFII
ncbi:CDP-alcohol phosphatidyltransferase family protein [Calidifontibacillus oryziterrae]|uniref:CDP-alcohol phosphatidyltransferase family protein n=1 Tax=Calidifontibacillus oryziterrae TaxID=1191699 RepID=UPI0002FAC904|nr:CDP-alcohol phosphatidyltransferase family protein [Calidifontibacillus oryziterrae]